MQPRVTTGLTIDGWTIGDLLHEGGMASIWAVSREGEATPCVMKVPLIRDADDPTPIVGFEVEQMILPRLSGPHVPRFVAAGLWESQPWIVMERIAGQSLKSALDRLPLPHEETVAIGIKVATALHDLHRQHVIHLDVKPSNLMLRESGEAVLVDFGLSRHELLPDLLSEEFRLPFGTAPYMSPEQVLRDRGEPRSDLFALGVMLYYLVTGRRPFGVPHGQRGLRKRLWRDPVPLRVLRPDCPPWLQEVVLRCLEVDPDQRHASAAQLACDLANPDQVTLTARAHRTDRDQPIAVFKRWLAAFGAEPKARPVRCVSGRLDDAPIIVAAVDLSPGGERLAERLRVTVKRILEIEPGARLACLNVLKTSLIAVDVMEDEEGRNLHMQRLIELKAWAHPLKDLAARTTCQVLEAHDPASALVAFARDNHVDHIVMGARRSSTMRRYLGSVSSTVVAEAPCSVTVVRLPESAAASLQAAAE